MKHLKKFDQLNENKKSDLIKSTSNYLKKLQAFDKLWDELYNERKEIKDLISQFHTESVGPFPAKGSDEFEDLIYNMRLIFGMGVADDFSPQLKNTLFRGSDIKKRIYEIMGFIKALKIQKK